MDRRDDSDWAPPSTMTAGERDDWPDSYRPGSWRGAGADDIAALAALEADSQPSPWSEKVFARELELDWSRIWVLDFVGPQPPRPLAAYLVLWVVGDEVHILNIVVAPQARRRGLARSILNRVAQMAARRDISVISLEVRDSNQAARRLYRSLGYREIGRREDYYPDNAEDAIVLARIVEETDGDNQ